MADDAARRDAASIVRTRAARSEHIALVLDLIWRDRSREWREESRAAHDKPAAVVAAVRRVVVDVLVRVRVRARARARARVRVRATATATARVWGRVRVRVRV